MSAPEPKDGDEQEQGQLQSDAGHEQQKRDQQDRRWPLPPDVASLMTQPAPGRRTCWRGQVTEERRQLRRGAGDIGELNTFVVLME